MEREKIVREEKRKKNEIKKLTKENFVKKFYPSCMSSHGGTRKLENEKPADLASTVSKRLGKVTAQSFDNPC